MKELLCDWILSCVLTVQPVTPLPDLYYGTVLYDYYQDDYQQALLDALIVERRGAVGDDPVRLQLAKGSFAFADGMFAMAEQTFASVGDGELTPLDKMRLSFHLAREDFRRQDWAGVERNSSNIDLGKSWLGHERMHPEVEFMRAEVATQHGDFAGAQNAIERIDPKAGISRLRAVQPRRRGARRGSARAGGADVHDARHDGRVRSRCARPQAARLSRVVGREAPTRRSRRRRSRCIGGLPAEGRYRDLALTSYGGLAMDNGNYELAARIWLSLKKDAYWSESSATAQLGFPMSLEHMSSRELALTQLSSGRGERSKDVLSELQTVAARAEDPVWVGGLLQVFAQPSTATTPPSDVMNEWRQTLGHTDWLEWLATEDVQELLLQWRELHAMQDWLKDLPDELATFDALSTRTAAPRRGGARTDRSRAACATVVSKPHRRSRRCTRASTRWPPRRPSAPPTGCWRWPTPDEAKLLNNLSAKRALLMQTPDDETRAELLARVDYLEGIVFWNLVEERHDALARGGKRSDADRRAARGNRREAGSRVRAPKSVLAAGRSNRLSRVPDARRRDHA